MIIVDNKALVLKTRRPHLVTEKILKSKVLNETNGMYEVAVKWNLDEAQQLTDIGARNVPSPITRDYKWSGKLEPFAHQKETSSFLTLHKKAFCFKK